MKGNEVLIISVGWDEFAFEPTSPSPVSTSSYFSVINERARERNIKLIRHSRFMAEVRRENNDSQRM